MSLIRQPSKDTSKVYRVRIPAELAARLEAIESSARSAGLVFALNEAVADSLDKLAAKAERELADHVKGAAVGGGNKK